MNLKLKETNKKKITDLGGPTTHELLRISHILNFFLQ